MITATLTVSKTSADEWDVEILIKTPTPSSNGDLNDILESAKAVEHDAASTLKRVVNEATDRPDLVVEAWEVMKQLHVPRLHIVSSDLDEDEEGGYSVAANVLANKTAVERLLLLLVDAGYAVGINQSEEA